MLSIAKTTSTAHRKYVARTLAFMSGYVAINVAAIFAAWLLALSVSAPVVGQIWATLMLMRDSDEYVRAVTAKRFILAAGVAMAIASVWGFGESYADAAHIPAWMIYPLFWGCYGVISPLVRTSN